MSPLRFRPRFRPEFRPWGHGSGDDGCLSLKGPMQGRQLVTHICYHAPMLGKGRGLHLEGGGYLVLFMYSPKLDSITQIASMILC